MNRVYLKIRKDTKQWLDKIKKEHRFQTYDEVVNWIFRKNNHKKQRLQQNAKRGANLTNQGKG